MPERCFVCRGEWGGTFACRLTDEADPDRWVQVYVCGNCWHSAGLLHTRRLAEEERQRLAAWMALRKEDAVPAPR